MSPGRVCAQSALGGVAVLALAVIIFQLNRSDPIFNAPAIAPAEASTALTTREATPSPMAGTPVSSALVERPLFEPSRRPFKPPPPPAPPPPLAAPAPPAPPPVRTPGEQGFQLTGTMLIQGRHVAMLRQPGGTRTIRVSEGVEVGGWTAVRVQQGRITFRLGNREDELELPRGDARGTAARGTPIR